jgi:hypothetical protein
VPPAFEPPVDNAGPLTVRIQQPALGSYGAGGLVQFDQPDAPFTLNVLLSSAADGPLQGTLPCASSTAGAPSPTAPSPSRSGRAAAPLSPFG